MTELRFHGRYATDLSTQPPDVILDAFTRLLGPVISAVPLSEVDLPALAADCARMNNAAARAVRGTDAATWPALRYTVWRGCAALRVVERPNPNRDRSWRPFTADFPYQKQHYDVLLPSGEIVRACWPNAGHLTRIWGHGPGKAERYGPGDNIKVRPARDTRPWRQYSRAESCAYERLCAAQRVADGLTRDLGPHHPRTRTAVREKDRAAARYNRAIAARKTRTSGAT